jgi:RNA polymerase sigma-70 factor (ECF subfamily)
MSTALTASPSSHDDALPHGFATTHWSVVLSAHASDPPTASAALNQLCHDYWYPLYAYIRRQGIRAEDAEDLTQEFLADLLRRESLQTVAPEKGRFRSFLLVALKRFLINAHHRSHAAKRGAGAAHVPFDTAMAESRYQTEPGSDVSAEGLFERRWALLLVERVVQRLKAEAAARGKSAEFETLKTFLTAEAPGTRYADAGATIGLTESTTRVAVHRLRRRFRELFREEIAHTVDRPEDIDDEIRHLLASLSG